jgi:hypothetical protein
LLLVSCASKCRQNATKSCIKTFARQAKKFFEQTLKLASEKGGENLSVAGYAFIGYGELLYELNELDGAARLNNLFGKLSAANRTQAIAQARRFNLI